MSWTEPDDCFLRVHYSAQGAAWCGKRLLRSGQQVQARAAQLGLLRAVRGPRLTSKQIKEIHANRERRERLLAAARLLSPQNIAPRFGVHPAHIRAIEKGRKCKETA